AKAAVVAAVSVAYATTPLAASRARSRRARSSGGRSSSSTPRLAGSATSRSAPVRTSSSHRQVTGSVPLLVRRKSTRSPSGAIVKLRGTPRVNRLVLAYKRGKLSVMVPHPARADVLSGGGAGATGPGAEGTDRYALGMSERRLLFVHAHPDDETIGTGATMAKYAAEGAHVTLVTCTLGEEGEIIPEDLAHLADDRDALGEHRVGELKAARSEERRV